MITEILQIILNHIKTFQFLLGIFISTVGGSLILRFIIDERLWPYIDENTIRLTLTSELPDKRSRNVTCILGMLERASYTIAIYLDIQGWVAIWLALKVAVGWHSNQTRKGDSANLYLIGCVLSIMIGVFGGYIANGSFFQWGVWQDLKELFVLL